MVEALPSTRRPSPESVSAYVRAHHFGGFYGLLIDRLRDQQTADPALTQLCPALQQAWEAELIRASSAPALAQSLVQTSRSAWRVGVRWEQQLLRKRRLSVRQYLQSIVLKLSWIGASTECLLLQSGDPLLAARFRRAYSTLLICLQCSDDAHDQAEDRRLRGISFPEALGVSMDGLCHGALRIARLSAPRVRSDGFFRIADALEEQAAILDRHYYGGSLLEMATSSNLLTAEWEALWKSQEMP